MCLANFDLSPQSHEARPATRPCHWMSARSMIAWPTNGDEAVKPTLMLCPNHLCVTSFAHVAGRSAQEVKGEASFLSMSLAYGSGIALRKWANPEYALAVKPLLYRLGKSQSRRQCRAAQVSNSRAKLTGWQVTAMLGWSSTGRPVQEYASAFERLLYRLERRQKRRQDHPARVLRFVNEVDS